MISQETNGRISDKAPAEYVADRDIFPGGAVGALLSAHFGDGKVLDAMTQATEQLGDEAVGVVYEKFLKPRDRAILQRVREACGVPPTDASNTDV